MSAAIGFLLCLAVWATWAKFGKRLMLWFGRDPDAIPWAHVRSFHVLGDNPGHNDLMFVSRHDIAECGLTCPNCQSIVAERGDFSGVRRTLVNGVENEVVKCAGRVIVEGNREEPCPSWLAASPNTEHGDHLDAEGKVSENGALDTPDFYRFKRITPEQALREKYGFDVATTPDGSGMQIQDATVVPVDPPKRGTKHDVLVGQELQEAIRKELLAQEATKILPVLPDPEATPIIGTPTPKDSPNV